MPDSPSLTIIEESVKVTVQEPNTVSLQVIENTATVQVGIVNTIGPQGPQGETGPQGPEGPQGVNYWGPIQGTLSDQADLQAALDAKAGKPTRILTVNAAGGADYTTISSAVTAASALTPSSSNIISILVYPGTYGNETFTLPAYVNLIGLGNVVVSSPAGGAYRGPVYTLSGDQTVANITFAPWAGCWRLISIPDPANPVTLQSVVATCHDDAVNNTGDSYVLQVTTNAHGYIVNLNNYAFSMNGSHVTSAALMVSSTADRGSIIANNTIFRAKGSGCAVLTKNFTPYHEDPMVDCAFIGPTYAINNLGDRGLGTQGCTYSGPINGSLTTADIIFGRTNTSNGTILKPSAAANVPLALRGAASQSADLQQWQNSAGTPLSRIDAQGRMVLATVAGTPTGTPTVGTTVLDTTANKLWVYCGAAGWLSTALA